MESSALHRQDNLMQTKVTRYSLYGAILATLAVIIATLGTGYLTYNEISVRSFVYSQQNNFSLWILDLMPIAFAIWGQKVGVSLTGEVSSMVHHQTEELFRRTEDLERQAIHDATHDSLTGLPNRILLRDRLDQALLTAADKKAKSALIILDLNGFKEINDAVGHHAGDRLLKQVATRLRELMPTTDTLSRLGGDEYAIVLCNLGPEKTLENFVDKILDTFNTPFTLNNMNLDVRTSIGAALYPEHGLDSETLLQRADIAMYVAKDEKKSFHLYDTDSDKHNSKRLGLLSQIRQAIHKDEMELYYQPKVSRNNMQPTAAEALVRWNHSEFGLIYPDEFIHLAEQTGLIVELTNWILRAACKQIRVWQEKGIDLNISINISPSSLLDPEFPDRLTGLLSSHKLNGKNITLEVTESSLVRDPELALGVLNQLAEQGILISIDDFGTGYSSLAYMKKMPASELKIDKSFVMDMLDSDSDLAIVKSTIDLAHNLHMSVVAEGVENREMLTQLKKLNCDYFQGYLFNRPANVTNFEKWLQEYSPSNYQ